KFIVRTPDVEPHVSWGPVNQPLPPETFTRLRDLIRAYYQTRELFVFDGAACADPEHKINIRVVSEKAWHSLFARCMFLRPSDTQLENYKPDWTIYHAPNFHVAGKADGVNTDVVAAINFQEKLVIAAGTHYAGEIKKSVFTILNYLLPQKGVLS